MMIIMGVCTCFLNAHLAEAKKRISMLQGVAAQAYQLAGIAGASDKVLDILSEAANGEDIGERNFLPIQEEDLEIGTDLAAQIALLVECSEVIRGLLQIIKNCGPYAVLASIHGCICPPSESEFADKVKTKAATLLSQLEKVVIRSKP